ncbi:SLAIN motif-containing protein 1a isoform X2 [Denticeps clupeoides]|uniref:SLAIN motif-containing protein 1a isoform X2 n=1 Tax=Denticeps clupeoides TaxID=299321 RepID=UPI0010A2CB48|nr:SLAIN motif-containing protein 1-like isoform X2 [Denticeps clupeoides]
MDAAVLNPRAMADAVGSSRAANAELEVKKLQELVRKLERQNEQLRSRASFHQPHAHAESTALDGVDILDLDALLPCDGGSEEDSWLYASSKAKPRVAFALTPLQWCRKVLDHPGPEVELAKRSLCYKLDQGYSHRWEPVSPQSSMDSELSTSEVEEDSITMGYKLQDMTDVQVMARLQEESLRQEYAATSSNQARRSFSFSTHSSLRVLGPGGVDPEEEEESDQMPPPQPRLLRTGSMQRSLSHSYNLSSLREFRRSPSTPQYLSSLSYSVQQQPCGVATPSYMPNAQGGRASTDMLRRSMPNLIRAPSMPSVPSMPNVAVPANHTSSPSLRNSQSFDSSNGLGRLQSAIPLPGQLLQRVQSVGNFSSSTRLPHKATAYVSPTIQGPSTPNPTSNSSIHLPNKPSIPSYSALPRPASFIGTSTTPHTKMAQPSRSLLTPPKSLAALSALRDGSWKDGCY